jgi:acyl dehydratase
VTRAVQAVAGLPLPGCTARVESGRLRAFARAIGETDPVYHDEQAARAAGHASLPVPPTFLFCLEMLDNARPLAWLEDLGVNLLHILHGEQRFVYDRVAVAGETLRFDSTLKDVFEKKNGALKFFVKETRVSDEQGGRVAALTTTIVVRRPA